MAHPFRLYEGVIQVPVLPAFAMLLTSGMLALGTLLLWRAIPYGHSTCGVDQSPIAASRAGVSKLRPAIRPVLQTGDQRQDRPVRKRLQPRSHQSLAVPYFSFPPRS